MLYAFESILGAVPERSPVILSGRRGMTPQVMEQMRALVGAHNDDWPNALASVGNCVNPIRVVGLPHTVDAETGEAISTYSSSAEPLGVTFIPCGNCRALRRLLRLREPGHLAMVRAGPVAAIHHPAAPRSRPRARRPTFTSD